MMSKMKKTNAYYFSVEGQTEKWYLDWLESEIGIDISTLGTGARNDERIKIKELIKR